MYLVQPLFVVQPQQNIFCFYILLNVPHFFSTKAQIFTPHAIAMPMALGVKIGVFGGSRLCRIYVGELTIRC